MLEDVTSIKGDLNDPKILLENLLRLRGTVCEEGVAIFDSWGHENTRRAFTISGLNMACYLALRKYDLRRIQAALPYWGLSSLGRSEARVVENLDVVIASLRSIVDDEHWQKRPPQRAFTRGARMLEHNTRAVLGPAPANRRARIMVTMGSEIGEPNTGADKVQRLLECGMSVARINCAHDDPDRWAVMVENIRRAQSSTGHSCNILMDLAGPKVRTSFVIPTGDRKRAIIGDKILLTDSTQPAIERDKVAFVVGCHIPEVLTQVPVGSAVWFDDGKIGAVVEAVEPEGLRLRVTHASEKGKRIRPEKGINFPGVALNLSPLTSKDLDDLDFVVRNADGLSYSFVQDAQDVVHLQDEIRARTATRHGFGRFAVVLKVETQRAVENLPQLIAYTASRQPCGVMIARGDLAVEIGYVRLAEMQEELLWLCEAAHVPVIWATQVLESYAKKGIPSRAEVTDAAMSQRAECVMVNKGPYVADVVKMLDKVLTQMQAHQIKKTAQLRKLHSWS